MADDLLRRAELTRRLRHLSKELQAGRFHVKRELAPRVKEALDRIRFEEQSGLVIEDTVDGVVRTMALALTYIADERHEKEIRQKLETADPVRLQRELFALLAQFFEAFAGKPYDAFPTWDDAISYLKATASALDDRQRAAEKAHTALVAFYATNAGVLFHLAKKIAGLKLVLGGGSVFLETQLLATTKMVLYADTVLLPDPVYAWIEMPRSEERFLHVRQVQAMWFLLQLKPLVDADLPHQAIFVFPSFEKRLQAEDPVTQAKINSLVANAISAKSGIRFTDFDEISKYATEKSEQFLGLVASHRLFIAPGQEPEADNLQESIRVYREEIKRWRQGAVFEQIQRVPDSSLVLMGIMERIGPQAHLLENAEFLGANPLLALPAHWHYYRLCSAASEQKLRDGGVLGKSVEVLVEGLNRAEFRWLGNVPIVDLVRLRADNENDHFRRELDGFIKELHESQIGDVEKVSAELSRRLGGLIAEHQKRVREIEERYSAKHKATGALVVATAAATFLPVLAPFLGLAAGAAGALGAAAKYGKDKLEEGVDRRQLSNSLLGVLANSKKTK